MEIKDARNRQLFEKNATDLSAEAREMIWALMEQGVCASDICKSEKDISIQDSELAYNCALTLINADFVPEEILGTFDFLYFENQMQITQTGKYKLSGKAEKNGEILAAPVNIYFSKARIDIIVYKAEAHLFCNKPWHYLADLSCAITQKRFLGSEYLNVQEKEILPLLFVISELTSAASNTDDSSPSGFQQFNSCITKLGYKELLPLMQKLENKHIGAGRKAHIKQRLISKLSNQKYEPLWRELFNIITASQAGYPAKAEIYSTELHKKAQYEIQQLIKGRGYTGQYPHFTKTGITRGFHLFESYNMDYIVGPGKNAVYHIYCFENYFNGRFSIDFICGTQFLRKNEIPGDIYSCLFNAADRRICRRISFNDEGLSSHQTCRLRMEVDIAVKKAELIKLSKEEQKKIAGVKISRLKLFFFIFAAAGGLFSILSTICFMLFTAAVCVILGQPQNIPSSFAEIPWLAMGLASWGLFGGAMGIIAVLSDRE